MSDYLEAELEVALAAVRTAAKVCRSVRASMAGGSMQKDDRSPVTVADYASQAVIARALADAFPDDPLVGEEGADHLRQPEHAEQRLRVRQEVNAAGINGTDEAICDWIDRGGYREYTERFWTVDPIDGTKGFLRGGQYAISLALIVNGRIELGVLGCPAMTEAAAGADTSTLEADDSAGLLFHAVRGRGAFMLPLNTDSSDSAGTRIHTSEVSTAAEARLCESYESSHSRHDVSADVAEKLGISRDPVRMDSQAKYAALASGRAEIYLRLPTRPDYEENIWDHAGGVLVVEEAGGTVTDVTGKPLDFSRGPNLSANRGVVVTCGPLHEEVIAAVRAAGIG
ncbi:MAG: 3'(2'),5'-bisphosphate nucleotidase [Planctomycetaceae bacterium]|nr:3'(2'),5'-bisphosphate nucleotidase [Planctomycetaceae bacterium]